jgi:hypothetical protein
MCNINRIPLEPTEVKGEILGNPDTIEIIQVNSLYASQMSLPVSSGASGTYILASCCSLFATNPGFLMNVTHRFSF